MGCLFFLCIFVFLPMAEFKVMGLVASQIGWWDTIFLLIFSAMIGGYFAKHQGVAVMTRMQQCLAEQRIPTGEMIDGILVLLAGALFIFPGFITDAVGLLFVFPLTRWLIRWIIVASLKHKGPLSSPTSSSHPSTVLEGKDKVDRSGVIDAEVIDEKM